MDLESELKKLVDANPAASDVFHVLALRPRNRSTLNYRALVRRMHAEGFQHPNTAYKGLIMRLSELGIGKLARGSRGRIIGLKDLKMSLQKIGSTALGDELKNQEVERELPEAAPLQVGLVVRLGDKDVRINIPKGTSQDTISYLVKKLSS